MQMIAGLLGFNRFECESSRLLCGASDFEMLRGYTEGNMNLRRRVPARSANHFPPQVCLFCYLTVNGLCDGS